MAAGRLEFRVLGPLTVRVDGVAVPAGGPKQRALLALLLLDANRVVSRERLIGELFAEQSVNSADHALRNHVSRLRRVLSAAAGDEPRLAARGGGYLLRVEPGELDLESFERLAADGREALAAGDAAAAAAALRAAEALWHGRPLGRSRVRAARAGRGGAARGAPAGGGRGADRRRTGARPPPRPRPRARGARRRAPVPRTLSRPADARALPLRPPGGRARGLPAHEDADGQRAGPRARGRAAAARTGDPRAGPGVEHLRRRARECAVTASGGLPVQGPRAVRADRRRVLLRPRAARRRARGAARGRAAARHRRAVGQRQVVAPPRRPAAGARARVDARAPRRAVGGRPRRRSRTRTPRASGSCSPSTSSRSCSHRRSRKTTGVRSSTRSSTPRGTRSAARSSWSRCAPTSSGNSRPTSSSRILSDRTTSCSGR